MAFPLELQGLSKAEIKKRITPILDIVGLSDRVNNYPSQLSGGQKQRVGIARAWHLIQRYYCATKLHLRWIHKQQESILELLKDINERMGLTIVLITHEMKVIREICGPRSRYRRRCYLRRR